MTTTIKSTGLALAGLGNDKPMLLKVARLLLADIFWDEDQETIYRASGGSERERMNREETPQVPDELDACIRMAAISGRIEQEWGESLFSLARRLCPFEEKQEDVQADLLYYACMAGIGHGIGPDSMSTIEFPDELTCCPIRIENPMLFQLSRLYDSSVDR